MRRLLLSCLTEKMRYRVLYLLNHKRRLSFSTPRSFTEKLYCRMYQPLPEFSRLADKFAVRSYVQEKLGESALIPLYKSTRHVTLDTLADLPEAFVMKSTHGAGQVRIIHNKAEEDLAMLAEEANGWMETAYSRYEKHYQRITPRIIFEKLLLRSNGQPPADYKIHIFNNGKRQFEFIQLIDGRFAKTTQDLFLADWSRPHFSRNNRMAGSDLPEIVDRPAELDRMMEQARELAAPFGYCRVDFYLFEGRVYFGELTFTPGGGNLRFIDPYWDMVLGSYFAWPDEPEDGTPLTTRYRVGKRLRQLTGTFQQHTN